MYPALMLTITNFVQAQFGVLFNYNHINMDTRPNAAGPSRAAVDLVGPQAAAIAEALVQQWPGGPTNPIDQWDTRAIRETGFHHIEIVTPPGRFADWAANAYRLITTVDPEEFSYVHGQRVQARARHNQALQGAIARMAQEQNGRGRGRGKGGGRGAGGFAPASGGGGGGGGGFRRPRPFERGRGA